MADTYATRQGDAWDAIAHQVYGSVKYTGWLMEHNHPHLDTFTFRAGVVLQTPDPPAESTADSSFRETQRSKTWENVTVEEIGKEIAGRAGVALSYDVEGGPIQIKTIEQSVRI